MTERGTLMFQVLAVLAIMAMTAPMLMRQRARQIAEVERRTVAEQTKRIDRALKEYIISQKFPITADLSQKSVSRTQFTVPDAELKPFLPESYFENGKIRANRLVESYALTVEAFCIEAFTLKGQSCSVQNLSAFCRCVRYTFHTDVSALRKK